MINRAIMNHLLCAGILLSVCAVIVLGPQSGSMVLKSATDIETTNATGRSRLNDPSEALHQTDVKNQNP